jgi:cytosine/creatinine deaminase
MNIKEFKPYFAICFEYVNSLNENSLQIMQMDEFLEAAIIEAQTGLQEGGIPIGSVIVHDGKIIGRGHNRRIQKGSVVLHAEMDALENAGRQLASVYRECALYTTLSPCPMCTGAILLYGIPKVIIGENKTYMGAEELLRQNGIDVIVVDSSECIEMMAGFIKSNPDLWNEDIGL